ncbi:MAG: TIGR00282 family metallophosphoesterase [bacterium]|nr:TIGR00282 family metallophosphoesterase [bacterium]
MLNVLYIGDAVGKAGRSAVTKLVPELRKELSLDAVFLNAENIAHGNGITPQTITEVLEGGVDFCSSGNHIWDNERGIEYLKSSDAKVIRPANFSESDPGVGWAEMVIGEYKILLINLIGEVFMAQEVASPFTTADKILEQINPKDYSAIFVDLHAEATSEKQALAHYLDGRVTAVVGTHTHVPTADLRVLPKGTGLVCDLGYVGARDSVLGFDVAKVLERFLSQTHVSLPPIESGPTLFNSVLFTIDPNTRLLNKIQRIDREIEV